VQLFFLHTLVLKGYPNWKQHDSFLSLKTKTEALDIKEEIAENKKQENTDNNKSE